MTPGRRATGFTLADGFTLIEMLVVIAVIAVLVGLTLAVIPIVSEQGRLRETDVVLKLLDQATQEWERTADRRVVYGVADINDPLYALNPDVAYVPNEAEAELGVLATRVLLRNDAARDVLRQIDERLVVLNDAGDWTAVNDPFGNPFYVIFPGRDRVSQDEFFDPDATVSTPLELRLGAAANRRTAFMSAGPDLEPGDLHLLVKFDMLSADQLAEVEAAADNVYSYPVLKERPQ